MIDLLEDLKVLVVDDNVEALDLVKVMLEDLGVHRIDTAMNGQEALDFLEARDYSIDVVLCDRNMPGMTGIELLRRVRSADPNLPFVIMTGAGDEATIAEAKINRATACLVKPYSTIDLRKKLVLIARVLKARAQGLAG